MGAARHAVDQAMARLDEIDGAVRAVCAVDGAAAEVATALDAEEAAGRRRGPLHGVPVVVKDNIDTAGLATTAGSLALAHRPPARDAPLVRRLRAAGLVLLGKANLSEWANIRDPASTSGWSAVGGLTRNPYGLNRSPGGSSSGSGAAVAARIAPLAVGTETDGSITCPAAFNGCVGIKPTVGLLPAEGIVPISASQDTAGPMALSVGAAATLLAVLAGDGVDYAGAARTERLDGVRVGVPRAVFWGYSAAADAFAERALSALSSVGAEIVDPADLAQAADFDDAAEVTVMLSELRAGLGAYLPTRGPDVPQTLAEVVDFNRRHTAEELRHFGQQFFEDALEAPEVGSSAYEAARRACLRLGRDPLDAVLAEHGLDALVTPAYAPAIPIDLVNPEHHWGSCTTPAAVAGYPLVTVPAGLAGGLPVAVAFWGPARSERSLIAIAAAYERARDAADGPLPAPTFPSFV